MSHPIAIACLLLTVVADGRKPSDPLLSVPPEGETKLYRDAYDKAALAADAAIKEGRAVLFTYGLLRAAFDFVDRETGLPIEPIAGCVVDDAILGRAAGNNDRIKDYVAKYGPPPGSFKRWEKDLFDLKGYVAGRPKSAAPARLVVDGPVSKSPDGTDAIRAVRTALRNDDGRPFPSVGLILTRDGVDLPRVEFFGSTGGPVYVSWGPEGSRFVVLACESEGKTAYHAYDARTGRLLRGEF